MMREQERAILPEGGVSLVIAGAGTGKTWTLVEKVKNLIRAGTYAGKNILVLTFSRKAAEEIRERVRGAMGDAGSDIYAGTFHSFCLNILKENRVLFLSRSGYRAFPGVLSEEEKRSLISGLVKERLPDLLGIPLEVACSLAEGNGGLSRHTEKKLRSLKIFPVLREIMDAYSRKKHEICSIDFEDMIRWSTGMIRDDPSLMRSLHERFRYILVDEFQDTSPDNFELITLLLPLRNGNLFAVGDDWQSIYGFRRAEIGYIIGMKKYFPGARVLRLTINYRSRREIVDISNRFIRKNRYRTRKKLVSWRGRGGSVVLVTVRDTVSEWRLIREMLARDTEHPGGTAVLFRNNWQVRGFADSFEEGAMPGPVKVMTIHASKGLEFDRVIIGGVSDSVIPDRSSDLEEERRLFYVALTRARERLTVVAHAGGDGALPRFAGELEIAVTLDDKINR